jgi:oligopeptide transport system permease protein
MVRFILRRVVQMVPMVLLVVSITWGLVRLAPGNFYTGEKRLPPAIEHNLRERYGLDRPWYVQYGKMLAGVARGDFGMSLKYSGQPVNSILAASVPISATLGGVSFLVAMVIGVGAGTLAAVGAARGRRDRVYRAITMIGMSMPNFVLGPTLVLVFSLTWHWLPPARWDGFGSHLVLPVLTLALADIAYIARLTRAGMLDVLHAEYIRAARAKGLSEAAIVWRHALRAAILPVVSYSGPALAFLLTGTVVIERVFALPGLGNYFINASLNRDEPLIIGLVAFIAIAVLACNLLADIVYAWLDPRVRQA